MTVYLLSGHKSRSGGHVCYLAGRGAAGSNGVNFAFSPLRLSHGLQSCFLSWYKNSLTLEGHKQFLGGTGPAMHSSGTGPVTLFWGTILALGEHNSR